ncbi:hypothetical protein GCM10009760_60700 [Kitasatospora kazusensis]|uniref:Uncharacterized protein n=1 Tax=Kitasatospora kazusensis TaxID=407974 RepID=A0ABN3AAR3_9ACTN
MHRTGVRRHDHAPAHGPGFGPGRCGGQGEGRGQCGHQQERKSHDREPFVLDDKEPILMIQVYHTADNAGPDELWMRNHAPLGES